MALAHRRLSPGLAEHLRAMLRARGLRSANWSHGGKFVFAIYKDGDTYVGTVGVDPDTNYVTVDPDHLGLTKSDAKTLGEFANAWNRAR